MKPILKSVLESAVDKLGWTAGSLSAYAQQAKLIAGVAQPVIIDCGAHTGATAALYHRFIPRSRIIAFEPAPEAFGLLTKNSAALGTVQAYPKAISNRSGPQAFNLNLYPETNSLLETDARGDSYWGDGVLNTQARSEVECITLNDFCAQQQLERIDILKLDIQGAEYQALEGASHLLQKQAISLIYSEILMMPTYRGQRKFWEFLEFLDEFSYELFDWYHPYRKCGQLVQVDALFISRPFKSALALFRHPDA